MYTAWQKSKLFQVIQKNQGSNKKLKTTYFTGTVNSTQNPVKSENEKLLLDGDCLIIKDRETNKKRLELGNVGGQFALNIYSSDGKKLKIKLGDHGSNSGENYAFAIYDDKGNPAIYMDENGEVYFAGTLKTSKSASIGTKLSVGIGADAEIDFMGPATIEGSIRVIDHEMDIDARYVRINGVDVLMEIENLKEQLKSK